MRDKIVVIGGGGHAKVIISILKKLKNYEIIGYTELENKSNILGVNYLGKDDELPKLFSEGVKSAVIGLGQLKSSLHRRKLVKMILDIGFDAPSIISPRSIINEDVNIKSGTVIMDGVIIQSGTEIGEFSIINTSASIDHDCKIGNFTHIAPGVTLSGEVNIGNDVLIGTGAAIIQGRKIVDNVIVAAGSTVTSFLLKEGIYIGVPARRKPTKEELK